MYGRQSSVSQIILEFRFLIIVSSEYKEFPEAQRIDPEFDISSGQVWRQFSRKQIGIRSGYIDVISFFRMQASDAVFPSWDILDLIYENITFSGNPFEMIFYVIIQYGVCLLYTSDAADE